MGVWHRFASIEHRDVQECDTKLSQKSGPVLLYSVISSVFVVVVVVVLYLGSNMAA